VVLVVAVIVSVAVVVVVVVMMMEAVNVGVQVVEVVVMVVLVVGIGTKYYKCRYIYVVNKYFYCILQHRFTVVIMFKMQQTTSESCFA